MKTFDRSRLQLLPLSERESKSSIEKIAVDPAVAPPPFPGDAAALDRVVDAILEAKRNGRSVMLAYGAHAIKNGLSPLLRRLVEEGYVTHLATNGAGSIHDWEFAFLGRSEEDVRKYAAQGQFGIWDETGRYINLALLLGAAHGLGYGESVGRMIHDDGLDIPIPDALASEIDAILQSALGFDEALVGGMTDLWSFLQGVGRGIEPGRLAISHPFKHYSVQEAAYACGVPLTIHPGLGYDIIYTSPFNVCAAVGRTAETDLLRFVASVENLNGGVYISVGSAIMSPMVFEKSLSMARNVARQEGRKIDDFLLAINDIQQGGGWQWGTGAEPGKDNPAYYLRLCKTFDRMGAREMHYVQADNRAFLHNLYHRLNLHSA